jgi:hypothetical protein
MVAVQSAFCLEMHQNKVFLFFKITIDTSTSKRFENIYKKKTENVVCTAFSNTTYCFSL